MVQFINRPPSFGEELARNLGSGFSQGMNNSMEFVQKMALQKQSGKGYAQELKEKEKYKTFSRGLQTLDEMEQIKNRGKIGRGTGLTRLFGGESSQDAAEYEQLGKSLIPIVAAGVPIRNQKEFDEYKKVLADASSSDNEIQGAIDGLRYILQSQLESPDSEEEDPPVSRKVKKGTMLSEDKAKQILRKAGGDKAKARQVAKKMGYSLE